MFNNNYHTQISETPQQDALLLLLCIAPNVIIHSENYKIIMIQTIKRKKTLKIGFCSCTPLPLWASSKNTINPYILVEYLFSVLQFMCFLFSSRKKVVCF
jgi:hypothetical protein